jgi:hypothetical protein
VVSLLVVPGGGYTIERTHWDVEASFKFVASQYPPNSNADKVANISSFGGTRMYLRSSSCDRVGAMHVRAQSGSAGGEGAADHQRICLEDAFLDRVYGSLA